MGSIFKTTDYREYLQGKFGGPKARTGLKSKLATHLDMKSSFLSRILKGKSNFTPEQALEVCVFFGLAPLETEYFVALVQQSRAGDYKLKGFYEKNLSRLRQESEKVEERLQNPNRLSREDALTYYSRWIYLAVHVAVFLPHCRSKADLQKKFDLSSEELDEVLDFLTRAGVLSYDSKQKQYEVGGKYTHIGAKSPLIQQHHCNWRVRALEKIARAPHRDLHYSGVFALSRQDMLSLKDNFIQLIHEHIEKIKPSKEEVICCQIIDFFEI